MKQLAESAEGGDRNDGMLGPVRLLQTASSNIQADSAHRV